MAAYNGTSQSVNFTLTGKSVVSSLVCDPMTLGANTTTTCTVTLSTAPDTSAAQVKLSKSGLSSLVLPTSVTVSSDATSAVFNASVGTLSADQNGILTAAYNGSSQSANLSLAAALVISSLHCSPTTLTANSSSTCTVTMSKNAAAGGAQVTLGSSGLSALLVPSSVTVAAGSNTATFQISTGGLTTSQSGALTATYGSSSKTVGINLSAQTVVSSLVCTKTTLGPNDTAYCTVTLSAPVNDAAVAISSNLSNLGVPRVVYVTAGSTSAGFKISTFNVTTNATGHLTASYNRSSQSVAVSLVTQ
jgi:hypothetical protein